MNKLYIACTLDGYIATLDDSLQWLFDVKGEGDNGYGDFIAGIDHVVMGKRTYDWLMREQPGSWAYDDKESYVLTSEDLEDKPGIHFVKAIPELTGETWVVGGGQVFKAYLELGLVDELQVTIAPVLLGDGIPLFPKGDYTADLELVGTKIYGEFVELHYLVRK